MVPTPSTTGPLSSTVPSKVGGAGAGQTSPAAIAASLGTIGTQQLPPAVAANLAKIAQQKKVPASTLPPRGNILPFFEHSRKRMISWAATGGFVRALAFIPHKYVISVTEVARTATQIDSQSGESTMDPHRRKQETAEGNASEMILWDAARPGTILHRIKFSDEPKLGDTANSWAGRLGNVFGFWQSPANGMVMASQDEERTYLVQIHIEEQGKDVVESGKNEARMTVGNQLTRNKCGAVSAGKIDLIALTEPDSSEVVFYRDLSETGKESLTIASPTVLSFAGSTLVVAYPDGMILKQETRHSPTETNASTERANCSSAPRGLHGMHCPNLTSEANNVQLQNQCSIQ